MAIEKKTQKNVENLWTTRFQKKEIIIMEKIQKKYFVLVFAIFFALAFLISAMFVPAKQNVCATDFTGDDLTGTNWELNGNLSLPSVTPVYEGDYHWKDITFISNSEEFDCLGLVSLNGNAWDALSYNYRGVSDSVLNSCNFCVENNEKYEKFVLPQDARINKKSSFLESILNMLKGVI